MKSDTMKELLKTFKNDSPVLGPVHRHLMSLDPWEGRRKDVIHPSELAGDDFCPRSVWYRLMGVEEDSAVVPITREVIFEAGHEYHRKWQNWLWRAGRLGGKFACLSCGATWSDVSPLACEACAAPLRFLVYKEVPVRDEEHNISGHGDGLVVPRDGEDEPIRLLEVKSIGEGTVRWDAPSLLVKHTHKVDGRKVIDLRGVWKDIRTPLIPHLRQVTIYGRILGIEEAVVLYEFKPTGQLKEFVVKLRHEAVEPRFESALEVMAATRSGIAPTCSKRGGGCDRCAPFEKDSTDEQETEEDRKPESRRRRRREAAAGRSGAVRAPAGETAEPDEERGRTGRPRTDGTVRGTRRLVRVREHAAE